MENEGNSPADLQCKPTAVDAPPAVEPEESNGSPDKAAVSASVSTANSLTIYARKGDQRHAIEIDSSADVSELRARVAKEFAQTPEHITLIYAGRILENGVTLERANVQDKHAMHVVIRQPRSSTQQQQQPSQQGISQQSPRPQHPGLDGAGMQHPLAQILQDALSNFPMFMDGSDGAEIQVNAVEFGPNDDPRYDGIPQQQFFQQVFAFDGNRMVPISVSGGGNNARLQHVFTSGATSNNGDATGPQLIDDDLFADNGTANSNTSRNDSTAAPNPTPRTHVRQEVVVVPAIFSSSEAAPADSGSNTENADNRAQATATNPQMREFLESHPEFTHALNNRDELRQTLQVARNPNLMREMMRNHDRALSNLESLPGGLTALERYYNEYQRPLMDAAQPGEMWSQGLPAQPNFLFPFPFMQRAPVSNASQEGSANRSEVAPVPPTENRNPLPNAWQNNQQPAGIVFQPGSGGFVMQPMSDSMPVAGGTVTAAAGTPGDAIAQALGMANGTQDASALQAMSALINEAIGQAEASGADGIEFNFQFAEPLENSELPVNGNSAAVVPPTMFVANNGGGDADNAAAAGSVGAASNNKPRLPTFGSTSGSNDSLDAAAVDFQTSQKISTDSSSASQATQNRQRQPAAQSPQLPARIGARNNEIAQQLAAMHISSSSQPQAASAAAPSPTAVMNPRIIGEALRLVTDRRALAALHVLHVVAPTLFPVDPLGTILQNQQQQQQLLAAATQQQQQFVLQQRRAAMPHHQHHVRHRMLMVPHHPHHQHQQLHAAAHRAAVQQAMANAPPAPPGTANVIVCRTHAPAAFAANAAGDNPMAAMRNLMATAPLPPSQQQLLQARGRVPTSNPAMHSMRFRDPSLLQQQRHMAQQQQQYHLHANMSALANMGFRNVEANRRALLAANGNILDAVRRLNEEIAQRQQATLGGNTRAPTTGNSNNVANNASDSANVAKKDGGSGDKSDASGK